MAAAEVKKSLKALAFHTWICWGCARGICAKAVNRKVQREEKLQRMTIQIWQEHGEGPLGSTVTEVTTSLPTALSLLTLPRTGSECQGHKSFPRRHQTALTTSMWPKQTAEHDLQVPFQRKGDEQKGQLIPL